MSALIGTSSNLTASNTFMLGLSSNYNTTPPTEGIDKGVLFGYQTGELKLFYTNTEGVFTNATVLSGLSGSTTYFFVARVEFDININLDARITLSVYGTASTTLDNPLNQISVLASINRTTDFQGLLISDAGIAGSASFDEFRLGTTLNDVAVPEPKTWTMLLIGLGVIVGRIFNNRFKPHAKTFGMQA